MVSHAGMLDGAGFPVTKSRRSGLTREDFLASSDDVRAAHRERMLDAAAAEGDGGGA